MAKKVWPLRFTLELEPIGPEDDFFDMLTLCTEILNEVSWQKHIKSATLSGVPTNLHFKCRSK